MTSLFRGQLPSRPPRRGKIFLRRYMSTKDRICNFETPNTALECASPLHSPRGFSKVSLVNFSQDGCDADGSEKNVEVQNRHQISEAHQLFAITAKVAHGKHSLVRCLAFCPTHTSLESGDWVSVLWNTFMFTYVSRSLLEEKPRIWVSA